MASKPSPTTDTKLVRELAKILADSDLNEIEMKKGDLKIRVSKGGGGVPMQNFVAAPTAQPAAAPTPVASAPIASAAPASASHTNAVKSPMVGTAYLRPSPDAESFVKVGDKVKAGDTILLIEAMKTFNPITAEKSGVITDILIQDSSPVEFDDPLFVLD